MAKSFQELVGALLHFTSVSNTGVASQNIVLAMGKQCHEDY